jgi:uncharacterized glyoxalase superfamily protein PhnB
MAYTYATGIATDTSDLLVKLRDFVVTTTGWTSIQDTVTTGASGQYFAVRSTGESGNERIVLRFFRTTANVISVLGYLNWASGSGTNQIGSTSGTSGTGTFIQADDNNAIKYWFFGSLDRIIVVTRSRAATTGIAVYAGLYTRARSSAKAVVSNSPAAGTNVVINVADTSWATVGRFYIIADDNGYEWFKVTAITANASVTAERLLRSYSSSATCWVGEDPRPLAITVGNVNMGVGSGNNFILTPVFGRTNPTQGQTMLRMPVNPLTEALFLDAGQGDIATLWPLLLFDESGLGSSFTGRLVEVYGVSPFGVANEDTITVGTATYRVMEPSPSVVSLAVRVS